MKRLSTARSRYRTFHTLWSIEPKIDGSVQPINNADFIIPVEVEDQTHQVYVVKRPGVDKFMKRVGEIFEVVVFTASLAKVRRALLR